MSVLKCRYCYHPHLSIFEQLFMKIALSEELRSIFKRYSYGGKLDVDAFFSSWLLPKLF